MFYCFLLHGLLSVFSCSTAVCVNDCLRSVHFINTHLKILHQRQLNIIQLAISPTIIEIMTYVLKNK